MKGKSDTWLGRVVAERYFLVRLLGEGGMGAVYEAEHKVTRLRVAVKIMHPDGAWTATNTERFLREAQVANAIGHPNIVEAFDAGIDTDGTAYIVFRLIDGESVAAVIAREGELPLGRALWIASEVLDALAAAHKRGVIHRDIKPANVFITQDLEGREQVKLLDFGIAKCTEELLGSRQVRRVTSTGSIVGTADYMSPEQVRGERDIDPRTDLWSVGVMLYEMLSARCPFHGTNTNMVIIAIVSNPPVPLREVATTLPESLWALVDRALLKDRALRHQTASEMKAELDAVTASLHGSPNTVPLGARARERVNAVAPTLLAAPQNQEFTRDDPAAPHTLAPSIRPPRPPSLLPEDNDLSKISQNFVALISPPLVSFRGFLTAGAGVAGLLLVLWLVGGFSSASPRSTPSVERSTVGPTLRSPTRVLHPSIPPRAALHAAPDAGPGVPVAQTHSIATGHPALPAAPTGPRRPAARPHPRPVATEVTDAGAALRPTSAPPSAAPTAPVWRGPGFAPVSNIHGI